MDEDSRIKRLREYVQLYLRRNAKVEKDEQLGIHFLSEKSSSKFRESKVDSSKKKSRKKIKENQFSNGGNKNRDKKLSEEIGRNLHTVGKEPYQVEDVFDDVRIDSYPVENGVFASVSSRTGKEKYSKMFLTPEEANTWIRNIAMKVSKNFTQ